MNAKASVPQPEAKPEGSRGVLRFLIKAVVGLLITAAVLFIPAGRLGWTMGWVYIVAYLLAQGVTALAVDPGLLAERETRNKDVKKWDEIVVSLYGVASALAAPLVAGLGVRHGWMPQLPLVVQICGIILFLLGWAIAIWAMKSNPFFSKVMRIQRDRGHSVATGGPYRYVRHPGYVGTIAFSAATPLILGSVWALIPGALAVLLLIIRTALEDKTLYEELDGYKEYAGRVPYRLLPGVW